MLTSLVEGGDVSSPVSPEGSKCAATIAIVFSGVKRECGFWWGKAVLLPERGLNGLGILVPRVVNRRAGSRSRAAICAAVRLPMRHLEGVPRAARKRRGAQAM
jgi:hypothetical protein